MRMYLSVCRPCRPPFSSFFGVYMEQENGKPQSDGRHRMVLRVGIGNDHANFENQLLPWSSRNGYA